MEAPSTRTSGTQLTDIKGLRVGGIFPKGKEPSIRTLRQWTKLRRIPHCWRDLPQGQGTVYPHPKTMDKATPHSPSPHRTLRLLRPDRKSTRLNSSHLGISYA